MGDKTPTRDPFAGEDAILCCLEAAEALSRNSVRCWGAYIGAKADEIDDCLKAYRVTIADGFDNLAQAYELAAKLLTAPVLQSLRESARWRPPLEVVEAQFATSSQAALASVERILQIPLDVLPPSADRDFRDALMGLKPLPPKATKPAGKRRNTEWVAKIRGTPEAERWRLLAEVLTAIHADRQYWTDLADSLRAVSDVTLGSLKAAVQTEWAHLRSRYEERHPLPPPRPPEESRDVLDRFYAHRGMTRVQPATKKRTPPKPPGKKRVSPAPLILAGLCKHHRYGEMFDRNGREITLNCDPIGVQDLAETISKGREKPVSKGTVSKWFTDNFPEGWPSYVAACKDRQRLLHYLKLLNQEYTPKTLGNIEKVADMSGQED